MDDGASDSDADRGNGSLKYAAPVLNQMNTQHVKSIKGRDLLFSEAGHAFSCFLKARFPAA